LTAAFAAAAIVLALDCATAQAPAASLANPGFEETAAEGLPPGWRGGIGASQPAGGAPESYRIAIDADNPREGRASARLERVDAGGAQAFGSMTQIVDARAYRGRRVRLTGAVRTEVPPGVQVGLWLRVDREQGRRGFFDNMGNRPITGTQWADYTIEGDVADDAERIALGLLLVGGGRAWIDDVRLEDIGPASPVAADGDPSAYLEQALGMLRGLHINSASADWPTIEARARASVAGSTQLADAHDAIQRVIADLGERHSFLRPPSPPPTGGAMPAPAMPTHALADGRFGVVRLPGFIGTPEQVAQYSATLRDGLEEMDSTGGVCGWIVDLRGNTGGNMWPMLNGLDPLLGPGPFGIFRAPNGQQTFWVRTAENISIGLAATDREPFFTLDAADAPVAVLLGSATASSGEMTAIALAGRSRARTFGAATAGFATANVALPLSDGAMLVITTSYARDRTGREYGGAIMPDEVVEETAAEEAAIRWLASQGSC